MERFGPTRRGGPVFRWLGEPLAIDLANTVMVMGNGEELDLLSGPGELRRWLEGERERLGDCRFAAAHLREIRELRDAVRVLLAAAANGKPLPRAALGHLNSTSAAGPVAPQLQAGSGSEPRTVEREAAGDPLAALLARLARAAITLLTGPDRAHLRICEAPSCGMFFLQESGRRWCCAACGNRARVARHYRGTPRASKAL